MLELANRAREFCAGKTLTVSHAPEKQTGVVWQRVWSPHTTATVWPEGVYDCVLLPLPRGKESLKLCLHAAASVLSAKGSVIVYGANDLGIRTAGKVAEGIFIDVESVYTGNHGRVWRLQSPQNFKTCIDDFVAGTPPWCSYPGLFAGGKLDDATALLLEHLPTIPVGAAVMDFACGIGVLAHAVKRRQLECSVTVVDNDPLALLAAMQNVPNAKIVLCGAPAQLEGVFDVILSNPPIHEGNEQSFRIVQQLIQRLPALLRPGGTAYIVTQITVPVARLAKEVELTCEDAASNRSFRVSRISARVA